MLRPIVRVVDNALSPRGWAVRAAEGESPLAYAPTKMAAISLARAHIEASRNGGTLKVYSANGQMERASFFGGRAADSSAASRRAKLSPNDLPTRPSADAVRKTIETMSAADAQTADTVAALLRTIMRDDELSVECARTWTKLRPDARASLLGEARFLLNSSAITAAAKLVDLLLSLQGLPQAASTLLGITQGILENDQELIGKLDDLKGTLQRVEAKLDEHVLVTARSAVDHLLTAAKTSSETVRDQQLHLAAGKFTELANLDPRAMTKGTSGEASNAALIVLGHWGNHIYLENHGEQRSALEEAYDCASKYPLESVGRFDQSYFSEDYRTQAADLLRAIARASKQTEARRPIQVAEPKMSILQHAVMAAGTVVWLTVHVGLGKAVKAIVAGPIGESAKNEVTRDLVQELSLQLNALCKRIADEAEAKKRMLQLLTESDLQSLTA